MKLSTKGRYGLRALVDIAMNSSAVAVSVGEIAHRQNISEGYLEQLMAKLKKAGIVKSVRGKNGGYVLAQPIDEITVGDILRALEGDLKPIDCKQNEGCIGADTCVTKHVWSRINEGMNKIVDDITLSSLIEKEQNI